MTTKAISRAADRVLLSSRIRFLERGLIFGRARLYFDRIIVKGWTWQGRIRKTIRLKDVSSVNWWTLTDDGPNLSIGTNNGGSLAFWVKSPGVWRFRIQELLSADLPGSDAGPRDQFVSAA